MKTELALIPRPRHHSEEGGRLTLKDDFRVWHTDDTALEAERLREFIAEQLNLRLSLASLEIGGYEISLSLRKPSIGDVANDLEAEAYLIRIDKKQLSLKGGSGVGVFWGVQTMRQIFEHGRRLSAGTIGDFPALLWRGLHFDLSGAMPTFATLVEILDQMAHYKLNLAILEYQDKFPYEKHSKLSSSGALTTSQIQRIVDFATDRHLEVMPLVQTLGHTEYVLRNGKYRHLGENNSIHQVCPSKPETAEFFKGLIDDVLVNHPRSKFLHLGGEEALELGCCPECAKLAKKKGKLAPFIEYIGDLCRYVLEKGIRPVIWADMFSRTMDPYAIRALPREVVLIERNCFAQDLRSPFVFWGPQGIRVSREAVQSGVKLPRTDPLWATELSDSSSGFLEKYWKPDADWTEGKAFPWLRFFIEEGFEVMGAGAAKGVSGEGAFLPDYEDRFNNLCTWAKAAEQEGIIGVVATGRSREGFFASPLEPFVSLPLSMQASADFFWRGEQSNVGDFKARFASSQFGDTDGRVVRAIDLISESLGSYNPIKIQLAKEMLSSKRERTSKAKRFLDYLLVGCDLVAWQAEFDCLLTQAETRFYAAQHRKSCVEEIDERIASIKEKLKEANGIRRRIRNVMKGQANPEDIREVTEGQISGRECRAKVVLERLDEFK